jgi:hypothetical protein
MPLQTTQERHCSHPDADAHSFQNFFTKTEDKSAFQTLIFEKSNAQNDAKLFQNDFQIIFKDVPGTVGLSRVTETPLPGDGFSTKTAPLSPLGLHDFL